MNAPFNRSMRLNAAFIANRTGASCHREGREPYSSMTWIADSSADRSLVSSLS
jgi:hypothetical protein